MESLFEPPQTVLPLGVAGAIGFGVLLLLGAVIITAAALLTRRDVGVGALVGAVLGGIPLGLGEHRFFRATAPDATVTNTALWVAVLLVPVLVAVALALLADVDIVGALLVAGSGIGAGVIAGVSDKLAEHLAAIPIAFGTLAALIALVVLFVVSNRH